MPCILHTRKAGHLVWFTFDSVEALALYNFPQSSLLVSTVSFETFLFWGWVVKIKILSRVTSLCKLNLNDSLSILWCHPLKCWILAHMPSILEFYFPKYSSWILLSQLTNLWRVLFTVAKRPWSPYICTLKKKIDEGILGINIFPMHNTAILLS
jgi:hypothetical protein